MLAAGPRSAALDAEPSRQYARPVGDRERRSEELPPEVESAFHRLAEHVHATQRRKAKRRFLAFLVIVVYGGIVANFAKTHDLVTADHPTLLLWFWAVVLGFVAFICVDGLLRDEDDE
jgi:hypothetical protein